MLSYNKSNSGAGHLGLRAGINQPTGRHRFQSARSCPSVLFAFSGAPLFASSALISPRKTVKTKILLRAAQEPFVMVSPMDEPGTDDAGNEYASGKEMWRLEAGGGDQNLERQKKDEWYKNGVAYWEVKLEALLH